MRYLLLILLLLPSLSWGAVSLPWSTTYACADWEGPTFDTGCDGLVRRGAWACSADDPGKNEQITASANYSGGDGGKGQRHWEAGHNNISGGTDLSFTSGQNELWMRWYMRFETDYTYASAIQNKVLFFEVGSFADIIFEFYGSDKIGFETQGAGYVPTQHYATDNGYGWTTIMGGSTGDNVWHYYEAHLKMDTNQADGILQIWVDGVLTLDVSNADLGTVPNGFTYVGIGENIQDLPTDKCYICDYDDIAINNTGYIGPLGDAIIPAVYTDQGSIDELGW